MRTGSLTKVKWGVDPAHSEFAFRVKYLMITYVSGVFRDVDVSIFTEGDDFLTSEIEVRINAASIDTGDEKRDQHLKSVDFFDVANHRQIVFIGERLEKTNKASKFILHGILSIRGVAMPVNLNVEYNGKMYDPWGVEKAGFTIDGEISRTDWELTWNTSLESGGVLVGDEVKINCIVQLIRLTEDTKLTIR